jgi:DNA-binding NtrC family response regulator
MSPGPTRSDSSPGILLVDDEPFMLRFLSRCLSRRNYRFTPHDDPEAALTEFSRDAGACDLLITDESMPKISWLELAARRREVRPDLRVIVCTGFDADSSATTTTGMVLQGILQKPIVADDLYQAISAALK